MEPNGAVAERLRFAAAKQNIAERAGIFERSSILPHVRIVGWDKRIRLRRLKLVFYRHRQIKLNDIPINIRRERDRRDIARKLPCSPEGKLRCSPGFLRLPNPRRISTRHRGNGLRTHCQRQDCRNERHCRRMRSGRLSIILSRAAIKPAQGFDSVSNHRMRIPDVFERESCVASLNPAGIVASGSEAESLAPSLRSKSFSIDR